jgi:hypothetical protein
MAWMATTEYLVSGLDEVEGREGGVEIQGGGAQITMGWTVSAEKSGGNSLWFRAIGKGAQDLEPNIFSSTHNKKKYSF